MYAPAFNCNYKTIGPGLKFSGVLVTEKKKVFLPWKTFQCYNTIFSDTND
jgi:hypothetical protein